MDMRSIILYGDHMTIAEVRLEYNVKVTDEQLVKLNAAVIYGKPWERDKDGDVTVWHEKLVCVELMPRDVVFIVNKVVDHPAFESLDRKRNPGFNQKVKVSVPDIGLMKIKHVTVFSDYCTEQVQKEIDRGWCILAICPQPDQRRPDYIMGRVTDPNL